MDWRAKVELYEKIRREFEGGGTISGVAKKLGVHRRMVREAIRNAVPAKRKEVSGLVRESNLKRKENICLRVPFLPSNLIFFALARRG